VQPTSPVIDLCAALRSCARASPTVWQISSGGGRFPGPLRPSAESAVLVFQRAGQPLPAGRALRLSCWCAWPRFAVIAVIGISCRGRWAPAHRVITLK